MEELRADSYTVHATADVTGLATGHTFTLLEPPTPADAGDYLVTATSIHLQSNVYESGGAGGEGESYHCSFTAIRAGDQFRPARLTPKPLVQGAQTAIVTGPAGAEIFTDDFGRVKVQFHWDRHGKHDENTTCFIRVSELWAGRRWGSTFTPRIGQEVVVAFLEGDPDQPIIVGSVYNGAQMPPYLGDGLDSKHKNDPNVSGIKSCSTKGGQGYNELRFDDTKGKEQIFVHAEKDVDVRVKDSVRETVGGNVDFTIGTSDKNGIVTGKMSDSVLLEMKKTFAVQAGSEWYVAVGEKGKCLELRNDVGSHMIQTERMFTVKTGAVRIEAETIHLNAGASFITLGPDGIYINGPMIHVNSGGTAEGAEDLPYFEPKPPVAADESKPGSPSN